jgi:hypothetical protein
MQSSLRVTRRALARLLAAPLALSGSVLAQPPPVARDASGASAGRGRFENAARQLAAVKLARDVEPATRFEA